MFDLLGIFRIKNEKLLHENGKKLAKTKELTFQVLS